MELKEFLSQAQILFDQGDYDQTYLTLKPLNEQWPANSEVLCALSVVSVRLGKPREALAYGIKAVEADPQNSDAHFNLASLYLAHGNYSRGFVEYEWRLKRENCIIPRYAQNSTFWDGPSLDREALMLHCEQGLGDALQFIRFLPEVRRRVKKIYLACHPGLVRLFSQLEGLEGIVTDHEPLPRCEFHCPLLSLPRIFNLTVETIPADVPYFHSSTSAPSLKNSTPRIGLVWRSNAMSPNSSYKSIPLIALKSLADLPVTWVSLQKDLNAEEKTILENDFHAEEKGSHFQDLQETADCVAGLDFVVVMDTSVAHLAGALGRSTGVLLPKWADWRWFIDRRDSPWYPTLTLFRQSRDRDWTEPVEALREELRMRFGK